MPNTKHANDSNLGSLTVDQVIEAVNEPFSAPEEVP